MTIVEAMSIKVGDLVLINKPPHLVNVVGTVKYLPDMIDTFSVTTDHNKPGWCYEIKFEFLQKHTGVGTNEV